jgi:diketogulonate reductase-like aldo/keto reductase
MNPPTRGIPSLALNDGTPVPTLGLGTWNMGDHRGSAAREVAALARGLDSGLSLIDTAEMYGDGGAEEIVGRAIAGRRQAIFVVTKVYPQNAGAKAMPAACERSLRRLGVDCIDLYLLHWRGRVPLAETVMTFERLIAQGKIRRWGVSNFDVEDMEELLALTDGHRCATNQVLYNLTERGIEWQLLDWCREHRIAVMAYSPVAQGHLRNEPKLAAIARRVGVSPVQMAIAWTLSRPGVIAIPQSSNVAHIDELRAAAEVTLDDGTLAALNAAFPPPGKAKPLAVI